MNEQRALLAPCVLRGCTHTASQQTPSLGHQVTHCGNRLWQQRLVLFEECFPCLHLKSLKSPEWGVGKEKEKEADRRRRRRTKEREREHSREDRKVLDGEDGKFGECGPVFNSGCQAANEQQGIEGWSRRGTTLGDSPTWVPTSRKKCAHLLLFIKYTYFKIRGKKQRLF